MNFKTFATAGLVASLSLVPAATPARADLGDAIAGAIIGGILMGAAKDGARKKAATKKYAKPVSGITAAQREQNREVQMALNFFGFPVGTADGSLGPKSRAAISTYQATLGYGVTGRLADMERAVLVTSYQQAMAGSPVIAHTMATHPMGIKGVLLVMRDGMAGIAPAAVALAPTMAAPAAPAPGPLLAPAGVMAAAALPALVPAEPVVAAAMAKPALPSFLAAPVAPAVTLVLSEHCAQIDQTTEANGGFVTADTIGDPVFALGEQFCGARTYAIAAGEEISARAAGFTPDQIAEQCSAFGPVMVAHVAQLTLAARDDVLAGVATLAAGLGMPMDQLAGTSRVCLGVGYAGDDMPVAVGSALLLAALGHQSYGELIAHHLSQGIGLDRQAELSVDWYDLGFAAAETGEDVFAPVLAGRNDVIRKAAAALVGRAGAKPPALPSFALAPAAPITAKNLPVLRVSAP